MSLRLCWFASVSLALTLGSSTAFADLAPAREALEHGDVAAAEPLLRAATGRDRADADRLLGRLLLETGRTDDARALGARLARVAATRVDGLTLEGEALAAVGEYDQAVQRWQGAIGRGQAGVARRARALAAVTLGRLGRTQDAQDLAQPLVDEYNDAQQEAEDHPDSPGHLNPRTVILRDAEALTYLGMAMRVLGFVQDANQAFNEAFRADAHRVETLLESAELYLSKEDMGHAGEALRDALAINAHNARALVLRARTRLMSDLDFAHAGEDLDAAEHVDPRIPEIFVLRSQIALRDGDVHRADQLVDQALAINPRHLDALAMRGVIRFDANDLPGFHRAFDEVFRVSPVFVESYAMLADFADWEHRYAEAATLMREGLTRPSIAAQPRLQGQLRAQLGMNLLRTGDEEHGLEELRESFRRDRYNVRVFNLLNLYEDTISHDYTQETSGPFRVRYHNDERAVMSRYAPRLLQRAYDDMVRRYHFTPEGPISIEMYSSSEHFSVRTSGLPEIGVQGVCFGKVITAISPTGGPFNWGQILWHELAHVFAIQMSHSRVPRWFTEGLSEWEAFHSHPEWAREDDGSLYRAMRANRVPRVADFNTAFTHARSGDDMMVAYYAASKLVEFLIDRYGFDRVISMLPRWGEGLATDVVVQRSLGVSIDEVDRQFREFTLTRLQRLFGTQFTVEARDVADREAVARAARAAPNDAEAQARWAAAELFAGEEASAREKLATALRLDAHQPIAHWVSARLALAGRDGRAALTDIDAILATHRDGYVLRSMEVAAARMAHDEARMRGALEAASRQDPSQSDPWEGLAQIAHRANRPADELRALREVVRIDQHNREALRRLFTLMEGQNLWADIRALADHARNLDPETADTHLALARAFAQTNGRDEAIFEYETALLLHPEHPAPVHVALARLYLAANNRARAQAAARAALQAAPADADARAIAQQVGVH